MQKNIFTPPQIYAENIITSSYYFKTSLEVLRKYAILYIKVATITSQILGKLMKTRFLLKQYYTKYVKLRGQSNYRYSKT